VRGVVGAARYLRRRPGTQRGGDGAGGDSELRQQVVDPPSRARQALRFRASWLRAHAIRWGLDPPVQLVELFVARDRLAMDGVLKSFELRIQMLYARLKDLDRALAPNQRPAASLSALCLASCGHRVRLSLLTTSSLSVGVARQDEGRQNRGRHFEWAASFWVQERVAVAVCAVVTPPPSTFKQCSGGGNGDWPFWHMTAARLSSGARTSRE
jgi:hypothetical protein